MQLSFYIKELTFSVPIKKELDNGKTYKTKFIDRLRFMSLYSFRF